MPAEKCKAGRRMAVGKHTFSLTLVVVTVCAFCMHSWMSVVMTVFTAEFIAVLWGTGILLFFWDGPKRKTALLFQSNALRHILSQRFIDNQKLEKPPIDIFTQFLANVYPILQNLLHERVPSLLNYQCSDLGTLLLEQFFHYYPVQIFLAVIWAQATSPRHYDHGEKIDSPSLQRSKLLVSVTKVVGRYEVDRITLPTLEEKYKYC